MNGQNVVKTLFTMAFQRRDEVLPPTPFGMGCINQHSYEKTQQTFTFKPRLLAVHNQAQTH